MHVYTDIYRLYVSTYVYTYLYIYMYRERERERERDRQTGPESAKIFTSPEWPHEWFGAGPHAGCGWWNPDEQKP